jgi:glycosyltransferase involved in cell wall biosynthesis
MSNNGFLLTVVVPTYNRSHILSECLQSLLDQTLPYNEFEIIVSDDGSTDNTEDMVRCLSDGKFPHLHYLWQQNAGANRARNRAINKARGRIVLLINDDSIAAPRMLEEHLRSHMEHHQENIGILGKVTASPNITRSPIEMLHLDDSYARWEGVESLDWRAFYTCNVSVKKSFLDQFGLFDETLRYHEDIELSERLSHNGFRLIYNPSALAYHHHYLTYESYFQVAKSSGKALAMWYKKSPYLAPVLAEFGFYKGSSLGKRVVYALADIVINPVTRPLLRSLSKRTGSIYPEFSMKAYRKLFKSFERQAIRKELKNA